MSSIIIAQKATPRPVTTQQVSDTIKAATLKADSILIKIQKYKARKLQRQLEQDTD